jgi:hypothetical protein
MEFQEFPKMLYYLGDPTKQKIVNSAEEEEAAGPDWFDTPIDPGAEKAAAAEFKAAFVSPQ